MMVETLEVQALGEAYLKGQPVTPTQAELKAFRQWLHSQFSEIPCKVLVTRLNLTLDKVKEHYEKTGEIIVSLVGIDHPFFTFIENVRFRAVHDWHHIVASSDDSFLGEWQAYQLAVTTAPEAIHWMLCSEIILQAAAAIHYQAFQEQKLVRV